MPDERNAVPDAASAEGSSEQDVVVDPTQMREWVGAYLLDALDENERATFEAFLATSPETQEEITQLAPVVALLPKVFESDDAVELTNVPVPASGLRSKIVQAAKNTRPTTIDTPAAPAAVAAALPDDEVESSAGIETATSKTIRTAPEPKGPFGPTTARPQGRIRSGMATGPGAAPGPTPIRALRSLPAPWLAAASIAILAIGAVIWALALQGRIDNKEREIAAQSAEIAELRRNSNATAYSLAGSADGAPGASGTLLYSLKDQIGILYVRDLPALAQDQVYQLWYLQGQDSPVPGGTFRVDGQGNGIVIVDSETPTYDLIALTAEPEGGSAAPTGAILLTGQLSGAAG